MKPNRFRRWLVVLLLLGCGTAAWSQTWTASAPEDGGTYYLYNVEYKAMVYGHNDWDTRASLTTQGGILFTLVSAGEDGSFYLSDNPLYKDCFLGYDGTNAFVDVLSSSSNYACWKFTAVEGMENTFTMRNSKDDKYIVGHASDATKTSMTATQPTSAIGYWKLVKRADLIADLANADGDSPLDATWLMTDPDIGKNTDATTFWKGSPAFSGVDNNWCFEKYNTTFDVYQEVTGVPNGIYELKCQGFYRMGSRSNARDNRNAGTEALNAKYYINEAEGSLKSIFEYSRATAYADGYNENTAYVVGGVSYYLPNTHKQAANCCRKDEYWNEPIRVVVTDNKIRVGVKKTVTVSSDWSIFDNFVLTYYGVDMTAMLEQAKARWASIYGVIAAQAADHSAYDALIADADDYCITEEKLAEYDGILHEAIKTLLQTQTPVTGTQFDITSLITNPTFDTSTEGWTVSGTPGVDTKYGVGEFFNQSDVSLTQTLADMPVGTYTLKAQAFYRSTKWRDAVVSYQIGTDEVKARLQLGDASIPVCNIYDQTRYQPAYLAGVAGGSGQKMAPDTTHGASATFDIGHYWNLLNATTSADGNLTVGLTVEEGLADNWMCFDNFRLYYGNPEVPVDLSSAMPTEDMQASTVTTGITLQADGYNQLCLPFDLDATQTAAAFSAAYTLAGVTSEGVGQLVPAYTIEAGKAYFVTVDATETLSVDHVRIRVAQPDSIPVMWEGAATVGRYDDFSFDINGSSISSYAPVDFQNMSFIVNQENWRVRRFLSEVNYPDDGSTPPSQVAYYNAGHPVRLDQPHSVFIPVPQNNAALTVTVSKNSDYSEAETFAFDAGTTLCEVPNLVPQNTYYYKVEAAGTVLTKGQFQTEGHLRMIKIDTGFNVRDLGGWETIDGNRTRYGKVFRGGELNYGHTLSEADLAELRRLGVGAEVDFRFGTDVNDETPTVSVLGSAIPYLYIGFDWADMTYGSDVNRQHFKDAFNFTLEHLREGKAVYFHCRIGADRTGMFGFLLDGLCGFSFDNLLKEYELTTFSEAGTRQWDVTDSSNTLLTRVQFMKGMPGQTWQQKFFNYMNMELGIPAADLLEFIDLMVDGTSSIHDVPLSFGGDIEGYRQTLDGIAANCPEGSSIAAGMKAQLSDGTTTTEIPMSVDGIAIHFDFTGATLTAGKQHTLTIPANAVVKGEESNTEAVWTTIKTPAVFDGEYYFYQPTEEKFLSRGATWGTRATLDSYGVPALVKTTIDNITSVQFLDNSYYLGVDGSNNSYADMAGGEDNTRWTLEPVDEGFVFRNSNGYYIYMYNNYARGTTEKSDALPFVVKTQVEQKSLLAAAQADNILAAAQQAGIVAADLDEFNEILSTHYVAVPSTATIKSATAGSKTDWVLSEPNGRNESGNAYNVGSYGGELYLKNASVSQTVTVPHAGLYKLSLTALLRQGSNENCYALGQKGYVLSNAYVSVNDVYTAQIPDWYSGCTSASVPNNTGEAKSLMDGGKYAVEVWAYIGDEKQAVITITVPAFVPLHWCLFNNFTLTEYAQEVTISEAATEPFEAVDFANVTLTRTLQPEIWNTFSLPFSQTKEQIAASELAGATIFGFKESDASNIQFQIVDAIDAGVPYLVKLAGTEAVSNPTFNGVTIVSTEGETTGQDGNVQMVAQVYNRSLAGVNNVCYLATSGSMKRLSASGSVKGMRTYFIVPSTAGDVKLFFDETPTDISLISDLSSEDEESEAWFTLDGRQLNGRPLQRGIYIVGGRKVFIK